MRSKESDAAAGTSGPYGVRGFLRASIIAGSLLALLNGINACKQQSQPAARLNPMNLFGMTKLPTCGTDVPKPSSFVGTFRLKVDGKAFDDLVSNAGRKDATYAPADNEANEAEDDSNTTYSEGNAIYNVRDNPYSTDLTTRNATNAVFQYVVMLKAGKGIGFMTDGPPDPNAPGRKINGILADKSLIGSKFICVEDPVQVDSRTNDQTTTFYVKNGSSTTAIPAGFNIVLVPSVASDTPVIIDPKILNNG